MKTDGYIIRRRMNELLVLPRTFRFHKRLYWLMDTPVMVKDPVCGMDFKLNPRKGWDYLFEGTWYHFCGSECRHKFQGNPAGFLRPKPSSPIAKPKVATEPRNKSSSSFSNRLKSWFR
jgi:YHS domain-containing protein